MFRCQMIMIIAVCDLFLYYLFCIYLVPAHKISFLMILLPFLMIIRCVQIDEDHLGPRELHAIRQWTVCTCAKCDDTRLECHPRLLTIRDRLPSETAYHLRLLTIWDCLPYQTGVPSETVYRIRLVYHLRLLTYDNRQCNLYKVMLK